MKRILLLLMITFPVWQEAFSQPMRFMINVKDSLGAAYQGSIPFSIRNSDSIAFPNGLTDISGPMQWGNGQLYDSMRKDSSYTNNLVTINYFVCGAWHKFDTVFTGFYPYYTIHAPCLPPCDNNYFSVYNGYNGATSFYAYNPGQYKNYWYFGDGGIDSGNSVSHQYASSGTYIAVRKQVHLTKGCISYDSSTVLVQIGCGSNFTFQSGSTGFIMNFNSSAPDSNYYAYWTFGDGGYSYAHDPSHTYSAAGTYTVRLIVTNGVLRCQDTITKTVTAPGNCMAKFSFSHSGNGYFHFDNETPNASSVNSRWDFGDGTIVNWNNFFAYHIYNDTGHFAVKLKISGPGCSDSVTHMLVYDGSCQANVYNYALNNTTFHFTNNSSGSLKTTFWDFGDGDTVTTSLDTITHTFTDTGNFAVTLIMTTKYCKDTVVTNIYVADTCSAYFYASPRSDRSVDFIRNATAYNGTYVWDFGDGNSANNPSDYFNYQYTDTGLYNVKLKVTGIYCVDSSVRQVRVKDPCEADFSMTQTGPKITINFAFHFDSTDHYWNFGDGNTSTQTQPSHVYSTPGTYVIKHVVDYLSCQDSSYDTVTVTNTCGGTWFPQLSGNNFSLNFQGAYPSPDSVRLDFGDGFVYKSIVPYHFYYNGTYQVELIIYSGSCRDTLRHTVNVAKTCSADFTFSPSGNKVYFYNASSSSYPLWDFGDGQTSNQTNPQHTYAVSGTYLVKLLVTTQTCRDSIYKYVTYHGPCNAGFTINAGNSPYTYQFEKTDSTALAFRWIFDGTDSSTANPVNNTFNGGGYRSATLQILDSNGNVRCSQTQQVLSNKCGTMSNMHVYGWVTFDDTFRTDYDSLRIYFIVHDSSAGTLTAIDSMDISNDSAGFLYLACESSDNLLIKAATLPSSPYYNTFLPTYSDSATLWSNAASYQMDYGNYIGVNVNMRRGVNPGGPGFIGGLISLGANKSGEGLKGIQVNVYTESWQPVAYTYSGTGGEYTISNLPYGRYRVIVEIPLKASHEYIIELSPASPGSTGNDFEINRTYISALSARSFENSALFKVYPNPAGRDLFIAPDAGIQGNMDYSIVDVTGKVIGRGTIENSGTNPVSTIDVSQLPAGTYLLLISNTENQYRVVFVKN